MVSSFKRPKGRTPEAVGVFDGWLFSRVFLRLKIPIFSPVGYPFFPLFPARFFFSLGKPFC